VEILAMIPDFDQLGLLPVGVWDCSLAEIEASLGWNEHRRNLLASLKAFLEQEWKPLGLACPIYVDGSFIRRKQEPADIDLVLDLSALPTPEALKIALALRYRWDEFKRLYNLDVWTRHPSLPNDLVDFFQYTGDKAVAELRVDPKHPKGILRIQP
jgi:hypothetical protein